jgi:spore germination cell wall hydrolase CwlJ-like protein
MKVKILALLLSVALISAAGAAQARNDSNFRASAEAVAEVQNNQVLPPTAARIDVHATLTAWKNTFKTMFDPRTVAKSCLAQAVYFEARSESVLGQLAVATVILNRAKAENYPSSICGVVYQGAARLTGCQFSFACDDKSNLPQIDRAWETALAVTAMALSDDQPVQSVAAATYYHADYVTPAWSKSMHRLAKIGRHIFYSQG